MFLTHITLFNIIPFSLEAVGFSLASVMPVAFVISMAYSRVLAVKRYLSPLIRLREAWGWALVGLVGQSSTPPPLPNRVERGEEGPPWPKGWGGLVASGFRWRILKIIDFRIIFCYTDRWQTNKHASQFVTATNIGRGSKNTQEASTEEP